MRPFRIVVLTALFCAGCATTSTQKTATHAPPEGTIAENAPYTADEIQSPEYLKRFAVEHCNMANGAAGHTREELQHCDALLQLQFKIELARRYFAVDKHAIEVKCKQEWIACSDPHTLESWVRQSHNANLAANESSSAIESREPAAEPKAHAPTDPVAR